MALLRHVRLPISGVWNSNILATKHHDHLVPDLAGNLAAVYRFLLPQPLYSQR